MPVLDLTPLPLESCCTLTETAEKEIHGRHRWHAHQIDIGQKEDIQNYLTRLLQSLNNGQYMKAFDAVVELWQRGDYSALISEFKTFWHPINGNGTHMLAALPIEKQRRRAPHVGVEFVMTHLATRWVTGFYSFFTLSTRSSACSTIFCGYRISATDRPRSTNSKTLRQDARSWLLKYPEHAITGLLPAALGKAGEARDNARAALRMLTENGHQPLP